jgi:hypothetical protein
MRLELFLMVATVALAAPHPLHDSNTVRLPERPEYNTLTGGGLRVHETEKINDATSKADSETSRTEGAMGMPVPTGEQCKWICWDCYWCVIL